MTMRIDYKAVLPAGIAAMRRLADVGDESSIDKLLRYLIELRISQINGCAYCVDLHSRQATEAGETARRLNSLSVWREAPFYTEREKAAFAWAESVTLIAQDQVPDAVYAEARRHFSEKELVELSYIVVAMNGWNRLAISFRQLPAPN